MARYKKRYQVKSKAAIIYLLLALFIGFGQGVYGVAPLVADYLAADDGLADYLAEDDRLSIASQAALLTDEAGREIYTKQADIRIPPASLTKLLTAWVVVKQEKDLDRLIVVDGGILQKLQGSGASTAKLQAGEILSVRQLLAGLLQPSGADAALVLAEAVSGSEAAFVRLMNGQAKALNMMDSHFTNVSGLDNDGHYSTVHDLMRLWQAVLAEPALAEIVTVSPDSGRWTSTLLGYDEDLSLENGKILGGKTGYTQKAGQCLASFAEIDGKRYYLVTAGAPGESSGHGYHLADAKMLYGLCVP